VCQIKYDCKSDFHIFIKVNRIIFFFQSELIRLRLEKGGDFFRYNIIIHFRTFTQFVGIFNNFSSKHNNLFIWKPFLKEFFLIGQIFRDISIQTLSFSIYNFKFY